MKVMTNNYWQKRYESLLDDSLKRANLTNDDIKSNYARALRRIEKAINDWYRRYAHENSISLADARKLLDAYEMKAFTMDLEEFIKTAKREGLSDEHKKILENASIRERLSREQELYINVIHEVERLATSQNVALGDLLKDVYESSIYKTAYTAQSQRGEYSHVRTVDATKIDNVVYSQWANDGKDFSQRIWAHREQLVKTLQNDFVQGLMLGHGMDTLATNLSKRMSVSYNNAKRLVETETARVHEQGFLDAMKTIGVDELEILATLDRHTSTICRHMDGKRVRRIDAVPGVTVPPFHCYCRSTTVPYLPELEGETRTARDPDTGKSVSVEGDLTYDEWYNKYVKNMVLL